ncbi:MAG: CHASE domain-containing protein [Candidatus Woesebacteria bacterium]|jgi:PAS domain S-box-containing protein
MLIGSVAIDPNGIAKISGLFEIHPISADVLLVLAIIAIIASFAGKISKIIKAAMLLALLALIVLGVYRLFFDGTVEITQLGISCLMLISLALCLAIIDSANKILIFVFKASLMIVGALMFLSAILSPFKLELENYIFWLVDVPLSSAALILVLAVAVFRSSYKKAHSSKNIFTGAARAALVVGCVSVLLTGYIWRSLEDTAAVNVQQGFEEETNDIVELVDDGLSSQALALEAGAGLFMASPNVSRAEWNNFFSSLRPLENFPGAVGIGFARLIDTPEKKKQFEQVLQNSGFGHTEIYPQEPARDYYVVVDYVAPHEENASAIGYDMYSSTVRKKALDTARDSGEVTMSDSTVLIVDESDNPQYSFQIYAPVYRAGTEFDTLAHRREGLIGFTLSPIRVTEFMQIVVGDRYDDIGINIYDTSSADDASEENLVYSSAKGADLAASKYSRTVVYAFANHNLVIEFGSLPGYASTGTAASYSVYVLISGIMLSLFLGTATYGLYRSRRRVSDLAKNITEDLRLERNQAVRIKKEDEAILSSMGQGMMFFDRKAIIRHSNVMLSQITGYPQSEYLDHKLSSIFKMVGSSGKIIAADDEIVYAMMKNSQMHSEFERLVLRKDGSTVPVKVNLSLVLIGSEPIGVVAIITDMTKQHQLDQAKDMFLMLATHQIKTPATAIKWYAEMLLGRDGSWRSLPADKRKVALLIDNSVKHMLYVMNNLLDVSRLETGRLRLDLKRTSLDKIVRQVVGDFKFQTKAKGQRIKYTCSDGLALVATDKQLMTQVFANLISNAVKYSPNGGAIEVCIEQDSKNVSISISDSGMGIPKDQHAEVFKKFFRAQNAVKEESSGNGLGLYLAKAVVEASGGKITFKSTKGKGSTFTVTLPRHTEEKEIRVKLN